MFLSVPLQSCLHTYKLRDSAVDMNMKIVVVMNDCICCCTLILSMLTLLRYMKNLLFAYVLTICVSLRMQNVSVTNRPTYATVVTVCLRR